MKGKLKSLFPTANPFTAGAIAKGFAAAAVLAGVAGIAHRAALAQAEALLQQQGTLAPMEDTYTFEGEQGQTMTIELQSEDFDPVLLLKGPDGEVFTSNDDYGGTLNSTIVVELPDTGTYSAVASSFSGQGGNYQIEVRPSSEYEKVFSRAYNLSVSEDFADAIEAYTAAIALNDSDPGAYLGRAEARLSQAYMESTIDITDPADLPKELTDQIVADFLKAADLLEQQGQSGPAASLREQAGYFAGEVPPRNEPQPQGSEQPSAPAESPAEVPAETPAEPMPGQ